MENQTENTKFIIQRYDNFISAANIKGNFLLAFNAFLTGAIIANYSSILSLNNSELVACILNISLYILGFAGIITTILVINAVYPFLKSGNSSKDKYHSHIFFNSVSEFESEKKYYDSLSSQDINAFNNDLAIQAFQLAKGLKKKYQCIGWAMRIIYIELTIILINLILIIFL